MHPLRKEMPIKRANKPSKLLLSIIPIRIEEEPPLPQRKTVELTPRARWKRCQLNPLRILRIEVPPKLEVHRRLEVAQGQEVHPNLEVTRRR